MKGCIAMEFFMGKNTVTLECIRLEASALMATYPHKEERRNKKERKKERKSASAAKKGYVNTCCRTCMHCCP